MSVSCHEREIASALTNAVNIILYYAEAAKVKRIIP